MVDKKKNKDSGIGFFGLLGALGIGALLGFGVSKLLDKEEDSNTNNKNNNKVEEKENSLIRNNSGNSSTNTLSTNYKNSNSNNNRNGTSVPIESMFCPISCELMTDPVITPDGISYNRKAIEEWLNKSNTCPLTKNRLVKVDLRPNRTLRDVIEQYIKENSQNNQY